MAGKRIVVIPDVHGREFWKEAVRRFPDEETVFLGEDPLVLNRMLHDGEALPHLLSTLSDVSYFRGGPAYFGSCVWADYRECVTPGLLLPGYLHIFGHTQGNGPARVYDEGVCLDCRRAFVLNPEDGSLESLDN